MKKDSWIGIEGPLEWHRRKIAGMALKKDSWSGIEERYWSGIEEGPLDWD